MTRDLNNKGWLAQETIYAILHTFARDTTYLRLPFGPTSILIYSTIVQYILGWADFEITMGI
jgi:hypothetical protein